MYVTPVFPHAPVELLGQVLERDLPLEVAPPLHGGEPPPGVRRGGGERGGDGHLRLGAHADVDLLDAHDWLVQVVVHRQLEALARLQVVEVVERLRVQQHAQTVGLANLAAAGDVLNKHKKSDCDNGPVESIIRFTLFPLNSFVQKGRWLRDSLKLTWGLIMAQMPTSVPK